MPAEARPKQTGTSEIIDCSDRLAIALKAVINASPAAGLGPIEAARILGVDKTFASRLLASLRARDSLTALSLLPGTAPIRHFLRAARAKGTDRAATMAAESELTAFDQTLQRTFGTRTHLDAVIAEALPEARKRQQEAARQAVYRGMTLIKGVSFDLASISWLIHPSSAQPGKADMAVIAAFTGIRRLRASARVRFISTFSRKQPERGRLLPDFCRPDTLSITEHADESSTTYEIATGPIRRDATSDVAITEYFPGGLDARDPCAGGRAFVCGDAVAHAYRRLILSLFIHRDVWPGCDFGLRVYDPAMRGIDRLPNPSNEDDQLDFDATLVRSPASPEVLRASPIPDYPDMLHAVAAPRRWNIGEFRLFQGEFVYPLYGSQIFLVLKR